MLIVVKGKLQKLLPYCLGVPRRSAKRCLVGNFLAIQFYTWHNSVVVLWLFFLFHFLFSTFSVVFFGVAIAVGTIWSSYVVSSSFLITSMVAAGDNP